MKGGLVVGLLVMDALKESGYRARPLKFIMIGDEELSEGLSGKAGKSFIRDSARGCAEAITLEGGDGKRIMWRELLPSRSSRGRNLLLR